MEKLRQQADLLLTLGLMGVGFILYVMTAAPSVLMADAGEFQFVPYIAGITHPTGYPLYTILGWVWTHCVAIGDVAYRMNLFSALWGGVTIGLIYQVAAWGLRLSAPECPALWRRVISALTAALVMASGTFWSQAVIAEVYTLNSAFVAAILYIALRLWDASKIATMTQARDESGPSDIVGQAAIPASPSAAMESRPTAPQLKCARTTLKWLAALSLACGLSLAHHRTTLLLLPWLGLFAIAVIHRANWPRRWWWWPILAGLLLPQALYLYILWRAPHVPYLELRLDAARTLVLYENNLRGFLDLVVGGAFGGQLAEGPIGIARLEMALTLLRDQFTWVGISLGIIGLLAIIRKRVWPLLMLTIPVYLSYVVFNLFYFIGDIYVLFIPSYLIWAMWIGWGVWELASAISTSQVGKGPSSLRNSLMVGVIVLSFSLPVFLLVRNYPLVDQSQNRNAAHLWQPILEAPLPQSSILVSNDRDEIMPMWYYQYVDGLRPDLVGLFPLIVRQPGYEDVVQVIDSALATGRPTFLIKPMPGLELKYELRAQEPLVQVAASHESRQPQHALDVSFGGTLQLIGYDAAQESNGAVRVTLFWKPTQKMDHRFSSFVHLNDATGKTLSGHDHQPGGDYYPTEKWKPGEVLLDTHTLSLPQNTEGGEYQLTTGLYLWPSMERLGQETSIGTISIDTTK